MIVGFDMQGIKMLLNHRQIVEAGQHGATKMDPVDSPWIFFVTAICMFSILWKYEEFVWTHLDFYEYYKSGSCAKDHLYFLRGRVSQEVFPIPGKTIDERTSTSHDNLVAQILALERYDQLLVQKLMRLNKGPLSDGMISP